MKVYYTSEEVSRGVNELPPISKNILRNLRINKKIKYTKIGKECVYRKSWIEDYINSNIVEVAS